MSAKSIVMAAAGAGPATYIEDVFSTYLYTGNGSTQTITNGIDLAGKGGLVWIKSRASTYTHMLCDTARGNQSYLSTPLTDAAVTGVTSRITSFNGDGFSLGASSVVNPNTEATVSWTFRKQPKFFDVVTYTGNGANRTIAHSLGSAPGCIIVKRTDTTGNWQVYHNSLTSAAYGIQLNLTNAQASDTTLWNSTAPTNTVFSLGTNTDVNASGGTYVAYVLAHNAGGFGLTGTDNVISCGSYTGTGAAGLNVTLGYEPQWVLIKRADSAVSWYMGDIMRGLANVSSGANTLQPNTSSAEQNTDFVYPNATGFTVNSTFQGFNASGGTYIYIAIRRGPMKVPTDATKVFAPISVNAAQGTQQSTGFPVDLQMVRLNAQNSGTNSAFIDRLRGVSTTTTSTSSPYLASSSLAGESTALSNTQAWGNTGFQNPSYYGSIQATFHNVGRAPGFFDEVCYAGTSSNMTVAHNLGVVPELMIVKVRNNNSWDWCVYAAPLGATKYLQLNLTTASGNAPTVWNNTSPTASVFSLGTAADVNASGFNHVAYLFASCPGVSKVGSYTGNGSSQTINCGFAAGARFVLIKRTDSTGDWYVWDTARGIVTANDPRLSLNTTTAEVTTDDSVDPASSGFIVNQLAGVTDINVTSATYIYLAIA